MVLRDARNPTRQSHFGKTPERERERERERAWEDTGARVHPIPKASGSSRVRLKPTLTFEGQNSPVQSEALEFLDMGFPITQTT